MSMNVVLADGVQPTVTSLVTLYTAAASLEQGTRVIAFTATNTDGTVDTYDVHIVPSGGSANLTNKLVDAKTLIDQASDNPVQVHNQLIPPGGSLQVKVSTGTTIAFRGSGIEF